MPRGKKNDTSKGNFSGYRFISYDLNQADKEWLATHDVIGQFPLSLIDDLVLDGFKVSFSEDAKNNSFIASATDKRESSSHRGAILTGRGSTTINAWISLCYRHYILSECDWGFFDASSQGLSDEFG